MSVKNNSGKNNTSNNKEQMYQQCLLRKRSGNVSILDVSWIPVEYAVVGKVLKLKKEEGKLDQSGEWKSGWDDGWIVIKVYGVRSESDIVKMNWDYRKWSEIGSS